MYLKITWILSGRLFFYNKLDHKHDPEQQGNKNLYIQNGYDTQYLSETYNFIMGEIWNLHYEAVEMLFTPILNIHHKSKIRTTDQESKQPMSHKLSNK